MNTLIAAFYFIPYLYLQNLLPLTPHFIHDGYTIIPGFFNPVQLQAIISTIDAADSEHTAFRKSNNIYAIRRFLEQLPQLRPLIFTPALTAAIETHAGFTAPVVKSIYFDKPAGSNWFVAWHQDLTISVDKKLDIPGFGPWTIKPGQFAVQPPVQILEQTYTIRIHLDDTDEHNGALKVLPGSHTRGIHRPESPDLQTEKAAICRIPAGGVMLMRPLLYHSSSRSKDDRRRRVIHIECCNEPLPAGLEWAEKI